MEMTMRSALFALAAGALAAAGPSLAQTAAPAAPAVATAQAPASGEDKVVCKREAETGSLLAAKKVCHTQGDWDRMARDSRDQVNAMTLRANHSGHT
jgi:invasion protein IalB